MRLTQTTPRDYTGLCHILLGIVLLQGPLTSYEMCLATSDLTDNAITVCILEHMYKDKEAFRNYCDWVDYDHTDEECKEVSQ